MRHRVKKSSYVVPALLALGIWASSPLAAAPPTADFYLNSAGSGANLAGVYTSPYTGSINGGPTIPVICDDFADESFVPEEWTAYVTTLPQLLSGTPPDTYLKFGDTNSVTGSDVGSVTGSWSADPRPGVRGCRNSRGRCS